MVKLKGEFFFLQKTNKQASPENSQHEPHTSSPVNRESDFTYSAHPHPLCVNETRELYYNTLLDATH